MPLSSLSFRQLNRAPPQERGDFSNTRLDLLLVRQEDKGLGDAFQDYLEENHDVELSSKPIEELRERIFIGERIRIIVLPEDLEEGILKKTSPVQIITINSNSSNLAYSMTNGYFTFANVVLTAGQTNFEALNETFSKEAKVTLARSGIKKTKRPATGPASTLTL